MKKKLYILLCCTMLLTACGTYEEAPDTELVIESVENEEPILTEEGPDDETENDSLETESILGYPILFADVTNETKTDVIGQRAYIEVSKEDLKDIDDEQYSELCAYVETLENNWFTVVCDDGTGLVFTECSSKNVIYGQLDDFGQIDIGIGNISKSGDDFTYAEILATDKEPLSEAEIAAETQMDDTTSVDSSETPSSNIDAPDPVETSASNVEASNPEVQTEPTLPENNPQPEETATVETPPAPEPEVSTPVGNMVWLSATGSKYHRINNCGRMNPDKARQVSLEDAINMGYEKCKNCY